MPRRSLQWSTAHNVYTEAVAMTGWTRFLSQPVRLRLGANLVLFRCLQANARLVILKPYSPRWRLDSVDCRAVTV